MARRWELANATIDGEDVYIVERHVTARLDQQTPHDFAGDVYSKQDFEQGVPSRFYVRHIDGASAQHELGWLVHWSNPSVARSLETNELVRPTPTQEPESDWGPGH